MKLSEGSKQRATASFPGFNVRVPEHGSLGTRLSVLMKAVLIFRSCNPLQLMRPGI